VGCSSWLAGAPRPAGLPRVQNMEEEKRSFYLSGVSQTLSYLHQGCWN
jgi:hypothetical protein